METFGTPPVSARKRQTLAEFPLSLGVPDESARNRLVQSLGGPIADPRLDGPIHGLTRDDRAPAAAVSGDETRSVGGFESPCDVKGGVLGMDCGRKSLQRSGLASQTKWSEGNDTGARVSGGESWKGIVSGTEDDGLKNGSNLWNSGDHGVVSACLSGNGNRSASLSASMFGDAYDFDEEDRHYSVGDFVWGKSRSHTWWPGVVYHPDDASDFAAKHKERDLLLVAYFGDGSFSWIHQSQLEPFVTNFGTMLKRSNTKNFIDAVQAAVDTMGRLVELEMTCSCERVKDKPTLSRPMASNGGIKAGVLVPDGGLGKFSISRFEPLELIVGLKNMARVASVNNPLEFTILKSRLAAFYEAKGGYQLPSYPVPRPIEGLEEKVWNPSVSNDGFMDFQVEGPFEDECAFEDEWISSVTSPGYGQSNQPFMNKCVNLSEDKLHEGRKQKSMTEILEDGDIDPVNTEHDVVSEGKYSKNMLNEVKGDKSIYPRRRGRKRTKPPVSLAENQGYCAENIGNEDDREHRRRGRRRKSTGIKSDYEQVMDRGEGEDLLEGRERNKGSGHGIDDEELIRDASQESHKSLLARERKKSKYLSPPYTTDLKPWTGHLISNQTEFIDPSEGSIGSPSQKHSVEAETGQASMETVLSETQKPVEEETIDLEQTRVPVGKLISELHSAAIRGLRNSTPTTDLGVLMGFLWVYRSSIYHDGSNFKAYHRVKRGRKRKSLHPEPGSLAKHLDQNDKPSNGGKAWDLGLDKKKESKVGVSNFPPVETNFKAACNADSAMLFMSFPPASALPSKSDLTRIYSRFGPLNEPETDMMYNSFCGRVVFRRTEDAEQAFTTSLKCSPFGAAKVEYKLRYPSDPPRIDEVKQQFHGKGSTMVSSGGMAGASGLPQVPPPMVDETSRLGFVKKKLEMVASMLEGCNGRMTQEVVWSLQGEVKGLLETVSAMVKPA